ncbi:hypothetical protein R6Q57_017129 [Mikania cordata]
MKKAFRDIKRGVNKKVLKVPSIEQKVLDATSNESWGPHGTHLADIAQASRNYHEHQIIMSVIWKRLNDTGKNWRHVFKALTVLEYLVANGSERVIEDVREHAYHISNLSSFQYIDSSGRDQGSNVRKKSQSLVALVNDKEKLQEAREKAAASSRFRQTPGDDRYEGQYGDKDEDHNGYGRERDWNHRDSYGRDGYGDDEHQRKSHSVDGDYGAKSQSSDRDDGHHSSRVSNGRVEDGSPDGSRLETKLSGQNLGAPPSYEDAVTEGVTPLPPPPAVNHQETVLSNNSAPPVAATPPLAVTIPPLAATTPSVFPDKETDGFDFFDPRAAPPAASSAEVELFGSLSDSFASDVLALVPSEPHAPTSPSPSQTFVAVSPVTQQYDDPFGDGPFRAVPSTDAFSAQQSTSPFTELPLTVAQTTVNDIGFGDGFDESVDILAGILPPTGPPTLPSQTIIQSQPDQHSTETVFHSQIGQPNQTPFSLNFSGPFGPTMSQPSYPGPFDQPTPQPAFPVQGGYQSLPSPSFPAQGTPIPQVVSMSIFYQQSQLQSNTSLAMQPPSVTASTGALAVVRQQPAEEKFETKSTVWADTLNRGLVNLNISGSKTNPLSDIGIDFEAINRKEKRMEKPSKAPVTSNVAMGKAMGSGSGIGRAGAGALKPAPNPMVGSGMGTGAPGYWSMGMNSMAQNMGIGMNSGQGFQMQPTPATGYMQPGSYNPMMGRGGGGYGQQPYGGYR